MEDCSRLKVKEVIRNTMKTSTKPAHKQDAIYTGILTTSVRKHEFVEDSHLTPLKP